MPKDEIGGPGPPPLGGGVCHRRMTWGNGYCGPSGSRARFAPKRSWWCLPTRTIAPHSPSRRSSLGTVPGEVWRGEWAGMVSPLWGTCKTG